MIISQVLPPTTIQYKIHTNTSVLETEPTHPSKQNKWNFQLEFCSDPSSFIECITTNNISCISSQKSSTTDNSNFIGTINLDDNPYSVQRKLKIPES